MRGILRDDERARVDEGVKEIERRTGAQIVVAVVERSDSYVELPWKAFALGASITCLVIFALGFFAPYRASQATGFVAIAGMLAFGGLCALLTVLMPGFARLFLSRYRSETEARQYAESLFLKREIFATAGRTGILLFVSLFEGQAVLLPDRGLAGSLAGEPSSPSSRQWRHRSPAAGQARPSRRVSAGSSTSSGGQNWPVPGMRERTNSPTRSSRRGVHEKNILSGLPFGDPPRSFDGHGRRRALSHGPGDR
ncbi:MAG TPA: hypothetical protein PKN85_01950 [Syntrophorhabdaceae bacterium]|nr:hypothetical protein [Syntrophorhabdaceae bacterium]